MRLKILNVDMYGYCGREYHPKETDRGRTVTVLHMEAWDATTNQMLKDHPAPESVPQEDIFCVYTCITCGGRKLELIDHEVEVRQ